MKNRRRNLIFIYLLSTIASFAMIFGGTSGMVYAETSQNQSKQLAVDSVGTYYLFPNNNGITNINDYFGYYNKDDDGRKNGNTTELIQKSNDVGVAGSQKVGHFYSDVKLENNLGIAAKNNALSYSLSASVHTDKDKILFVNYPDKSIMELLTGTSNGNGFNDFSSLQSVSVKDDKKSTSYVKLEINNFIPESAGDCLRIHFQTELSDLCGHVIMYVKEPTLTIKSLDSVKPELVSVEDDSETRFQQNRKIFINVKDDLSGVDNVFVNGTPATLENKSADTKTARYSFVLSGEGDYQIKIVDNLGNEQTSTHTECKIETGVLGNGTITNTIFGTKGTQVNIVASANANNKLFGYFVDGSFVETENETYNLTFGTNKKIVAKFKEQATLYVADSVLTYTGKELMPIFETMPQNLNVRFEFLKDSNISKFLEVGKYVVNWTIEEDDYYGSGTINLAVKKHLDISVEVPEFTFDGQAKKIIATTTDNVELNIKYFENGAQIDNAINSGTYQYEVTIVDELFVGSESGTFEIKKQQKDVQILKLNLTYDGTPKKATVVCDVNYQISYLQNGVKVLPKDAGEYEVVVKIDERNYVGGASATLVVEKAKLTISAKNQQTIYGEDLKQLEYVISGLAKTDEFDVQILTDAVKDVGTYQIYFNEKTNKNYDVTYTGATYKILPKEIKVYSKKDIAKIYGDVDPKIEFEVEKNALLLGDTLHGKLEREAGEDVGKYKILQGTLNNKNYQIEFVGFDFTILKRAIVVKPDNKTIIYGEEDQPLTYQVVYGSLLDGDLLDGSIYREQGRNAGKYEVYADKLENKNYDITALVGTYLIEKREITLSAKNVSVVYGTNEPLIPEITEGTLAFDDKLVGSLCRTGGNDVGTYQITLGTLEADNNNYKFSFAGGIYEITPKPISVVANSIAQFYGNAEIPLSYTITNGELVAGDKLFGSLTREQGKTCGEYAILQGTLNNNNYKITFKNGTYNIKKRELTVVANSTSKVYGNADGKLTYNITGVLNGEKVDIKLARTAGENAGKYDIVLASGNEFENYQIASFTKGTFTIEKATLNFNFVPQQDMFDGSIKNYLFDNVKNLNYTISYTDENGIAVAEPTNANSYVVEIKFENNQNYLDKTYQTSLVVEKCPVAITVCEELFLFSGSMIYPTYYTSKDVYCVVEFDGEDAIEVGTHGYKIIVDEDNFCGEFAGTLKIIPVPSFENEFGDKIDYINGKFVDNEVIKLNQITDGQSLKNAKNAIKRVIKSQDVNCIYSFDTNSEEVEKSTYKVALKCKNVDANKTTLFEVGKNGKVREVNYQIDGDYIVFNTSNLDFDYYLISKNNTIKFILILGGFVAITALIFLFIKYRGKIVMFLFRKKSKAKQNDEADDVMPVVEKVEVQQETKVKKPKKIKEQKKSKK